MKTLAGNLSTALASSATTLTTLVAIKLPSGEYLRMTTLDVDVTFAGNVYWSHLGCSTSQFRTELGVLAEAGAIETLIALDGVTPLMVERGLLDNAEVKVTVVDYNNTASFVDIFTGYVSTVYAKDNMTAVIEVKSLLNRTKQIAWEAYSLNCRADLGDAYCKVDIEARKANAVVTVLGDTQTFKTDWAGAVNAWQYGLAVFTSGNNKGMAYEISANTADGVITLRADLNDILAVGDTLTIYPGCDKTTKMCSSIFNNIINFRGEPFLVAEWNTLSKPSSATGGGGGGGGGDTGTPKLYSYIAPTKNAIGANWQHVLWGSPVTGGGANAWVWCVYDDWEFWRKTTNLEPTSPERWGELGPPMISTKNTKGIYHVADGYNFTGLDPAVIDWGWERELTPEEVAIVLKAYPNKPFK